VTFGASLLHFALSVANFKLAEKAHEAGKHVETPTIPHMIPFFCALGSLFPWNPYKFFLNSRYVVSLSVVLFGSETLITDLSPTVCILFALDHPSLTCIPIKDRRMCAIRLPWVQAVYAENLHLRIHGAILRKAPETLDLNGWLIPKNEIIVTCSTTAHMNPDVWSTVERGSHPTSEFHPARWLQENNGELHFSRNGTDGSWTLFGAGVYACLGWIFTNYQTILTLSLLVIMFDLEVTEEDKSLQMSLSRFGFGILSLNGKISYKIRKALSEQRKEGQD
jgi:hypothetical protein